MKLILLAVAVVVGTVGVTEARCDLTLAEACPRALAKTLAAKDPAPCQACATAKAASLHSACPVPGELASICKCEAAMAAACEAERLKSEFPCTLCLLNHADELVKAGCFDPELQGFCTLPRLGPAPVPTPAPAPAVNCTALMEAACPRAWHAGYNTCFACVDQHIPKCVQVSQDYCTPPQPHYPPAPPYVPPPPAPPLPLGQCMPDRNATVCGPSAAGCTWAGPLGSNFKSTMHKASVGSFSQCPGNAVCPFCKDAAANGGVCNCAKPAPAPAPTNKRRVNWYTHTAQLATDVGGAMSQPGELPNAAPPQWLQGSLAPDLGVATGVYSIGSVWGCLTGCPCSRTALPGQTCPWTGAGAGSFWNASTMKMYTTAVRSLGMTEVWTDLGLSGEPHNPPGGAGGLGPWTVEDMLTTGTNGGHAVADLLADFAVQADLDGIMVDYEPASMSNFSVYPAWLRVVGDALRKRGKKMGANVAGWGVLQNYQAFAEVAKLDLFASMDYGMNWHNLTGEIALLDRMIEAVHGDTGRLSPGLGSMTLTSRLSGNDPGGNGDWDDFGWNSTTFGGFIDALIQRDVNTISIWPRLNGGSWDGHRWGTLGTEPWFLDILRCFLSGTTKTCTPKD